MELRFEHMLPVLFDEFEIGVMAIENHLKKILAENMEVLKDILEGRQPIDEAGQSSGTDK